MKNGKVTSSKEKTCQNTFRASVGSGKIDRFMNCNRCATANKMCASARIYLTSSRVARRTDSCSALHINWGRVGPGPRVLPLIPLSHQPPQSSRIKPASGPAVNLWENEGRFDRGVARPVTNLTRGIYCMKALWLTQNFSARMCHSAHLWNSIFNWRSHAFLWTILIR